MKTLDEIGLQHGTDKSSAFHNYLNRYDSLLLPYKYAPVNFLEMGVLTGQSMSVWADYFVNPSAKITGIDFQDWGWKPTDPRQTFHVGGQQDRGLAMKLIATCGPFDVVIDDAGHFASNQIPAFELYWPAVKPGGLYIVEDTHSIHSTQLSDASITVLQYFHNITNEMQDPAGAKGCAAVTKTDKWVDVESVSFQKGFVVIRKAL